MGQKNQASVKKLVKIYVVILFQMAQGNVFIIVMVIKIGLRNNLRKVCIYICIFI